jgi:hypothetical protein
MLIWPGAGTAGTVQGSIGNLSQSAQPVASLQIHLAMQQPNVSHACPAVTDQTV